MKAPGDCRAARLYQVVMRFARAVSMAILVLLGMFAPPVGSL